MSVSIALFEKILDCGFTFVENSSHNNIHIENLNEVSGIQSKFLKERLDTLMEVDSQREYQHSQLFLSLLPLHFHQLIYLTSFGFDVVVVGEKTVRNSRIVDIMFKNCKSNRDDCFLLKKVKIKFFG